ncbi:hypothetical protein Tsp_08463 [Trichinella spiralis]|uniref:hypothetical protein n=1 Tax=Trichinella spiralis TaxID=6334 RepID=UPI0001EFB78F|nr:hypothetical protein Tsp_08463 [Trichinella spiralis]
MHHLQHYGQIATRQSFIGPTALKALEKLNAECKLKNRKYGYLDMLCGTRWSGNTTALPLMQSSYELQHVEAASCFDLLQCCDKLNFGSGGLNSGSVFVRFGIQRKRCMVI